MLRSSLSSSLPSQKHSTFDIGKNNEYICAVQLDDASSPIDRYGIDFTSIMPPWIPCNYILNYLLLEFQLPGNYFDILELEKNKYYWSVSIWLDSDTRLSSDLIIHYNSNNDTFLYAFEIPNYIINKELSTILLCHLVVKLIHSETSIPLAHSLIHLSIPICSTLRKLQSTDNKPSYDLNTSDNALQSLVRLRKLKDENDTKSTKNIIQSPNSFQLTIAKCTQIAIDPSSLISILDILPKNLIFPRFNVVCSLLPSQSSASHWKIQKPFSLRLFPSFIPTPRDIMYHLLSHHEKNNTKLKTNDYLTMDPENIIAVERRIYLTVTDLQLCPDLLKMCNNSNLIITAQGVCNDLNNEMEKKTNLSNKSIFLGTVYNENGDWMNQVEIKSSVNIGDRIDRIKFIVSLILYNNGKVQNQLLCEGDLVSNNLTSNNIYLLNGGIFDVLLKVPIKSHTHGKCIIYPESIGKITVKVDITGDGLDHPSIISNTIMINKYNATLDAFLSLSAMDITINDTLCFKDMLENIPILGLIDSFACLASCTSRIALMKLKMNTSTYKDISISQIMLFIELFAAKLTCNNMCDRNVMIMIGKILSDDILYAAHLAFALWLHHWVEEQNSHSNSSSLHLAMSLNDLVDEPDVLAEVSKYEMLQNSHRLFNKEEFITIRTACACLSLLRYSRNNVSGFKFIHEEQYKILHSFMLDNDSIDKLCTHLMRKILSHGSKLLENLMEKIRSVTEDMLENDLVNESILLHVEKFLQDVDNILSNVIECVSLVVEGSGMLTSILASVVLSFISTTITALHMISTLSQKSNNDNNINYVDHFGIERLSILLTLLSYILDSQPTGIEKFYSKGPTSLGSGPLGRDLQRYSLLDSEAALCNEYITNAIISITDYISNVSSPFYSKYQMVDNNNDEYDDFVIINKSIYSSILLINSLSSMSLTISTMIMANLQNFMKHDINYEDQVFPHVHVSSSYLSGEQALEYIMERATFLEALYSCSKSAAVLISSRINHTNNKSSTTSINYLPNINLKLIFYNRLVLDDVLNCFMKGLHNYNRDINDSAISIIFRTITYQSNNKNVSDLNDNHNVSNLSSYHIVMFLSHAVLSIAQYWRGVEILLQNNDLHSNDHIDLKLNSDAIIKTLHFDLTILKEAAATLCILCSNDSQLSVENMNIFIQKNNRYKHKKNNINNNENNNIIYRSDIITVEDALEGGPIMQWLRLWQILVVSLSDIIKSLSMITKLFDVSIFSLKRNNHQDDNILIMLIRMLIEISLLTPIRLDNSEENNSSYNDNDSIIKDISRPDLALFCLEEGFMINKIVSNKNDGPMIILKVLINTAISLAINDDKTYQNKEQYKILMNKGRSLIVNSCIDLLVLLQDMNEPMETALESLFINYIINLVGLTLPQYLTSKKGESIYITPSLNIITSLLCLNNFDIYDNNITIHERDGYSKVIQEVYQILLHRGKGLNYINKDHSDYYPVLMINKMFDILKRKLICYRCYIFGIILSYDILDDIDISLSLRSILNQLNSEYITEQLQLNYSILFLLSSLQYLLSDVILSKNCSHLDKILNEFMRIYNNKLYSSNSISEKLNIKLIQSKQMSTTVTNINIIEKMKKERDINRYTKFISNPCKLYGYGYFGTCEMIKLYLHDNHKNNNKYSAIRIEKGQQIIRSICKELLYSGEWDVCYRMLENRLDIYKKEMELHLSKSPAHNRYLTLINELELTKEKLLDHGNHDTHNRPCPLYYAVKFSVSPLDNIINNLKETDTFDGVLNDFYYATCCDNIDINNTYNDEDDEIPIDNMNIYKDGTWIILRFDATSYLTGSSLYSDYILSETKAKDRGDINDYKDNNERLSLFLPPQCYDNIELLLCKAFPSYHLVSPNEHQNFNNQYKSMQLFQAFPTNMLLQKYDLDNKNNDEEHESTYNDEYWENMLHSKSFYVYSYTNNDIENNNKIVRYTIDTTSILNLNDNNTNNDNELILINELNWCSPSSLGFINDINFYSPTDVLIDILDCQSLLCQPLIKGLTKLISLSLNELGNQPLLDITNQMSIIIAAISNIANIINHRSICIGYHNASEIIGAETERRELMWQEKRKIIKQEYIRNKKIYDDLYNNYMNNNNSNNISNKNNKKIAQIIYNEHGLDIPIEPNYQLLEKEYYNNNNDILINDLHNAHEDAIKIIETTISLLRDFINMKYNINMNNNDNNNDNNSNNNAGDFIKKYGTNEQKNAFLPKFSSSSNDNMNIHNEESLVFLQLILWLENIMVSLDFRGAVI